MNTLMKDFIQQNTRWLWRDDLRSLHGKQRVLIASIRMLFVMVRQLMGGQLNLRAMGLVYTTLLSIVPLLAVSFSVLKGFGVHNQLEPVLMNFLDPLGPKGGELTAQIIGFVENIKVGVLGSLGLAFLLYTVVSLIQKIEGTFNYVWRVDSLRGIGQRFSNYLSVILVGPVLVFASVGLTSAIADHGLVRSVLELNVVSELLVAGGTLLPYLLVISAFSFFYTFIPNTHVKLSAAVIGGVVAGVLWKISGLIFATFIASSSNYAAIYSSFAILILLLIWLYLSWLILLLGAQIAFFAQHPQYLTRHPVEAHLSVRLRERIALQIMYLIAEHHYYDKEIWTIDRLAHDLALPIPLIHKVLRLLEEAGFISRTADDPSGYLPKCDIETISLAKLLSAVRSAGENRLVMLSNLPQEQAVEEVMDRVQQAYNRELGEMTLKDLVTMPAAAPVSTPVST